MTKLLEISVLSIQASKLSYRPSFHSKIAANDWSTPSVPSFWRWSFGKPNRKC